MHKAEKEIKIAIVIIRLALPFVNVVNVEAKNNEVMIERIPTTIKIV